jgi:hypothetical protein
VVVEGRQVVVDDVFGIDEQVRTPDVGRELLRDEQDLLARNQVWVNAPIING